MIATPADWVSDWLSAWNSGPDLQRVLAHYRNDIEFSSPVAEDTVGQSVLRGKEALEAYWQQAVAGFGEISFSLDHYSINADEYTIFLLYRATLGGNTRLACEVVWLDKALLAYRSMALYGASVGS